MDLRRSCLKMFPRQNTLKIRFSLGPSELKKRYEDRERESKRERKKKGGGLRKGKCVMYILFSLEAFPPEIFCTLNWPSSVFSSRSCFWRSSFDLPHNWTVLILVVFDYSQPHTTLRSQRNHAFSSKSREFSNLFFLLPSCPEGFYMLSASLKEELCWMWCHFVLTCAFSRRGSEICILGCAAVTDANGS